jgi:hypothetical protein
MRAFYLGWPLVGKVSAKSPSLRATTRAGKIVQTVSAQLVDALAKECAARFRQADRLINQNGRRVRRCERNDLCAVG